MTARQRTGDDDRDTLAPDDDRDDCADWGALADEPCEDDCWCGSRARARAVACAPVPPEDDELEPLPDMKQHNLLEEERRALAARGEPPFPEGVRIQAGRSARSIAPRPVHTEAPGGPWIRVGAAGAGGGRRISLAPPYAASGRHPTKLYADVATSDYCIAELGAGMDNPAHPGRLQLRNIMKLPPIMMGSVVVTLLSPIVAQAAVLRVGDGTPQSCTPLALETALAAASNAGADVVRFRCGADPVTIALTATLTIPTDTTIDGGALVSLDVPSGSPSMLVPAGAIAVIRNLAFLGPTLSSAIVVEGTLTLTNSTLAGGFGAAIKIDPSGTLTVTDSTFSDSGHSGCSCAAIENRGVLNVQRSRFFDNDEAAIWNIGAADIVRCVFVNNDTDFGGGGAIQNYGSLRVMGSVFSHNGTAGPGGAILNSGTLEVTDSAFFANHATVSGGAISNGGMLTIADSQLIDNSANDGGGLSNAGDAVIDRTFVVGNSSRRFGGGIAHRGTGTLSIDNSFILTNATDGTGGGISVAAGSQPPALSRTPVTNNTPDDIVFQP